MSSSKLKSAQKLEESDNHMNILNQNQSGRKKTPLNSSTHVSAFSITHDLKFKVHMPTKL